MEMNTSKSQIGKIISEAYNYWMRTLPLQFLFGVIYFAVILFSAAYAFRYYGLFDEVNKFAPLMSTDFTAYLVKFGELMKTENAINFSMVIMIIKAVIFPLNIGFLKIYRKIDLGETPTMGDLFAGFQGFSFFVYALYFLAWTSINNYFLIFPPLSLLWIAITLFVPALIFFKNLNFVKAISIGFNIFKNNFVVITLACLVAILFSYAGILMFLLGIVITFPFWNAMIFVLYKHLIGDFD